jgi:hypothetical protein
VRDSKRAPLQSLEEPGEKLDQRAEAQVAERGQHADQRRQQNLQRVVELVSAQRQRPQYPHQPHPPWCRLVSCLRARASERFGA